MMDARILIDNIKTFQAEMAMVLLCNPETKKAIEEKVKKDSNVYLIEESFVEPNKVIMVKDLELKKALIESYKNRREGVE